MGNIFRERGAVRRIGRDEFPFRVFGFDVIRIDGGTEFCGKPIGVVIFCPGEQESVGHADVIFFRKQDPRKILFGGFVVSEFRGVPGKITFGYEPAFPMIGIENYAEEICSLQISVAVTIFRAGSGNGEDPVRSVHTEGVQVA